MSRPVGLLDFGRILRQAIEPRSESNCAPDVEPVRSPSPARRSTRKQRFMEEVRLVKAAQKAGLAVRRATIAGIPLELVAPEPAPVEEPPRASLFKTRSTPKMKVVL
jgi:hypothetical protein